MPRLKNDFVELLTAAANRELDKIKIEEDPRFACTVVAVSGGYPGEYEKGYTISGLNTGIGQDSILFHAGTVEKEGEIVTAGGRVLCITSYGHTVKEAVEKSIYELENISFTGMSYRSDIGFEFV